MFSYRNKTSLDRKLVGTQKNMGCVQMKSSKDPDSPPRGLEKLKLENGYVEKGRFSGHRKSTGVRVSGKETAEKFNRPIELNSGSDGDERVYDGWPKWLTDNVPSEVLAGLVPKSAESYDMLDKVGQGTYSNVYKARDKNTRKIVALKKVRFETSEPESVKFMAREITILRKLDHPNVVKLEGLATSRMQYSIYLVFDFMQTDLAKLITRPDGGLTEPQVKCYMNQLLSGLQHCHDRGILHRDIKGSNLLIDKTGMLKIADFGLANFYNRNNKRPLTNRVVTLWYRAPELLLGATDYGVGIDLWSAGCLLAEMFAGRPIMPGRTEVEQLHRIFKLCGTPSEEYWKKLKLSATFRPPHAYEPRLGEVFREFPGSSLGLLNTLLALDPAYRGSASLALQHEFFHTRPLACDLSGLPVVYTEDDEKAEAIEQRKSRRMKHRSRTHRERRRKDLDTEKLKEDILSSKEELEKIEDPAAGNQEPGSSTAGSTSSGTNLTPHKETRPLLLSSAPSSDQKTPPLEMSPRTRGNPFVTKNLNNLPPLLSTKTVPPANYTKDNANMYKLSQVHRSASTREFQKMNQRKHSQHYAEDD